MLERRHQFTPRRLRDRESGLITLSLRYPSNA
jgi:hypothetical protein